MFGKTYSNVAEVPYNNRLGYYMVYVGDVIFGGEEEVEQEFSYSKDKIEYSLTDGDGFNQQVFTFIAPTSTNEFAKIVIDKTTYKFEICSRTLSVDKVYYTTSGTKSFSYTTYDNITRSIPARVTLSDSGYKYYTATDIQNKTNNSFTISNDKTRLILNPDFYVMDGDRFVSYKISLHIEYDRLINVVCNYYEDGTTDEVKDQEKDSFYFKNKYKIYFPYIEGYGAIYPVKDNNNNSYWDMEGQTTYLTIPDSLLGGATVTLFHYFTEANIPAKPYTITIQHLNYWDQPVRDNTSRTLQQDELTKISDYIENIDNYKYSHSDPKEDFYVNENTTIKLYYIPAKATLTVIKSTCPIDNNKNIKMTKDYETNTTIKKEQLYNDFFLEESPNGYTLDKGKYSKISDIDIGIDNETITIEYYQTPNTEYALSTKAGSSAVLYCDSNITPNDIIADPNNFISYTLKDAKITITPVNVGEGTLSIGTTKIKVKVYANSLLIKRHCIDNSLIDDEEQIISIQDTSSQIDPKNYLTWTTGHGNHCTLKDYTPTKPFYLSDNDKIEVNYTSKSYTITITHVEKGTTNQLGISYASVKALSSIKYEDYALSTLEQDYTLSNGSIDEDIISNRKITLYYTKKSNGGSGTNPPEEEPEEPAIALISGWLKQDNGTVFIPKTTYQNLVTDFAENNQLIQFGTSEQMPKTLPKGVIYFVIG